MKKAERSSFNRLYWQISAIFIIVLMVFAAITLYISVKAANVYSLEVNQNLNRDLASNNASMIKPFLENGEINQAAIEDLVHSMMVINPSIEVYILDPEGVILSYVAPDKVVKLKNVNLAPIHEFLNAGEQDLIFGDDPRNPGEQKIFSVSEVRQDEQLIGYIYIVLASQEYTSASHMILGSYILGLSLRSVILILIVSSIVGLIALWFIVKKLNRIITGIKKFQNGDLNTRIKVKSDSDLDRIGTVFNDMADTIENNIKELKGIDELRKELISNISHDLRTPIASIQGYAETLLLKKDSIKSDEQYKYLEIIYKSCERLQKLVSDLFELSKLQTDQVKLNVEPFSVGELVHDIANKYRLISQKKGISINTIVSKDTPMVEADISLIDRVLQNLIDNAIKFCNDGDTINIQLKTNDSNVSISISDTGEGIASKNLPLIFERYYKNNEYHQSTGLGLAIVKKIIDLHHSEINVRSTLGKGTSFMFKLPVARLAV